MSDILISTMNDMPGYEITAVHGGEAKGYTKLLSDSRLRARRPASSRPNPQPS